MKSLGPSEIDRLANIATDDARSLTDRVAAMNAISEASAAAEAVLAENDRTGAVNPQDVRRAALVILEATRAAARIAQVCQPTSNVEPRRRSGENVC